MRLTLRLVAATVAGLLVGGVAAWATNDPGWGNLWNMRLIGAETAWATGTGKGITIAIVDSGVHLAQEDLAPRLVPGRNFVTPNAQPQDDNGHGTHVAGTAAAIIDNGAGVVGVAPSARIMPIKVLDKNGEGTYADAAAGIRWAVDNGAHVVNLSLGSTMASLRGSPTVFVESIAYAWTRGVVCVVAAGNDFVLSSDFSDENAIVVSATTKEDTAALYSNGVGDAKWALAAPGGAGRLTRQSDDIFSTYWTRTNKPNEYIWLAGTSMAAPHVAGAAAVLRSLGLTPTQTVDRLLATAKDLGSKGRDNLYGHGRLDVAKAVEGLRPAGQASNGGTGGGAGGGATATTATTASSGRRPGGGRAGASVTTTEPSRRGPAPSTASPAAPGGLAATESAPDAVDGPASLDPSDDGAGEASRGGAGREDDAGEDDAGGAVWPTAALALAALGTAAWAAARLRRLRV